jgi:hypothetical protein
MPLEIGGSRRLDPPYKTVGQNVELAGGGRGRIIDK